MSSLYVYTFHCFSLKFNHFFYCINTLRYKWEGISRFYEDAVRFHMAKFSKMKEDICKKKKKKRLLSIVIFSFLECYSNSQREKQ